MSVSRSLAAVFLTLALPAAAAADHHEGLMKEVTEIGDALAKAMVENDADTMWSMYAEDAISLPNYGPRMDGLAAFKKQHEMMTAAGMKILSFDSEPTEVWQAGDQVIEIGTFEIELQVPGMPEAIEDHGKYVTVYDRDAEGALKIKVETWNTDVNPMMAGEHEAEHEHEHGDG